MKYADMLGTCFYNGDMQEYLSTLKTAIGTLCITATDKGISSIVFGEEEARPSEDQPRFMNDCMEQLREYFEGTRKTFSSLPLVMRGTDFQQSVWEWTMDIPYGGTVSYGALAEAIGEASAARAVGSALGRNQLGIIVPCHRIVSAAKDDIGGFAWGLERKEWLLKHEGLNK